MFKDVFTGSTRAWPRCLYVLLVIFITVFTTSFNPALASDLIITGVIDGPRGGGRPKAVEFYVLNDIADLSEYSVESANNGDAAAGAEYTFPNDAVAAGTYLYLATEATEFNAFFGFAPDYTQGQATLIDGNDAVVLYQSGVIVDVFGEVGTNGDGTAWFYRDSWAYRNNLASPSATFNVADWTIGPPDVFDGTDTNAEAGGDAFPSAQWLAPAPVAAGGGNRPIINPDPDVQVRNGATLAAAVITSNALEPYSYGTVKRGQTVVLDYLVRNTGQQVLELADTDSM